MNSFLVVNPDKCIGCRTCEIACVLAHSPADALSAGTLDKDFSPRLKVVKTAAVSAPVQCRHCEDAPCANVCPTKAIVNRDNTIQINSKACIGCKSCMLACPFGAIDLVPLVSQGERLVQRGLKVVDEDGVYDKEKVVALKCDLCISRKEGPACAGVCPTQAFRPIEGKTMSLHVKTRRKACAEDLAALPSGNRSYIRR